MNRKRIQQYRMLTRVVDFGEKHVGLFPEHTIAGDLLADIGATVTKLTECATSRVSSHASILRSGEARRSARQAVKKQMGSTVRIARALQIEDFSIPTVPKEEDLISAARSFVEKMEPFKTEFSQHGVPPGSLKASIQALEESLLDRANGQAGRKGAIEEFNKLLDHALKLVDRFEVLLQNTIPDDALVTAAWKVARQIERIPRRARPEPEAEPETEGTANKPESAADKEAAITVT